MSISGVKRDFQVADSVLVSFSLPSFSLQATFSGPDVIELKLNETDYVVSTSDRQKKTCVCYVRI